MMRCNKFYDFIVNSCATPSNGVGLYCAWSLTMEASIFLSTEGSVYRAVHRTCGERKVWKWWLLIHIEMLEYIFLILSWKVSGLKTRKFTKASAINPFVSIYQRQFFSRISEAAGALNHSVLVTVRVWQAFVWLGGLWSLRALSALSF